MSGLLNDVLADLTVTCPQCGAEQEDYDGFGFVACVPGCGWCSHPSRDGGVCGICGDVERELAAEGSRRMTHRNLDREAGPPWPELAADTLHDVLARLEHALPPSVLGPWLAILVTLFLAVLMTGLLDGVGR